MPIALLEHIFKKSFTPVDAAFRKPANAVAELVESFWIAPAKFFDTPSVGFNDGVPTICVFTENQSCITAEHNGQLTTVQTAWLSSPYLKGVRLRTVTNNDLLIIRFHRNKFYKTFRIKPVILRNKPIWSLQDALGEAGKTILETLSNTTPVESKINAFEALAAGYIDKTEVNYILEQGVALIEETKGRISVNQLLEQLGVNYKWLERNFVNNLGVSPKEYIMQQRFMHTYSFCIANPQSDLLSIAVANGYYDQSHLIKDFNKFGGKNSLLNPL